MLKALAGFIISTSAYCAEMEPVTVVLECKGLVTTYKNGILRWSDSGPMYYRIEIQSSYAVVQFRIGDENYKMADRYDLKTFNSSYQLGLPSNTYHLRNNIDIDRLILIG